MLAILVEENLLGYQVPQATGQAGDRNGKWVSMFQIMSKLINVINNGDSEMRKSELLEFFRFHNRKLLKFGIF